MESETNSKRRSKWHNFFGTVLEKRYTPFGLTVYSHFRLMSESPEADIAIIRHEGEWTEEQYNNIPDGPRQFGTTCSLFEFKKTEALNRRRIEQAVLYHLTYKRTQNLTDADVQTFIVSSFTTQKKRLAKWGYEPTGIPGVYHNPFWIMQGVKILLLNELSPEPHNAFIKCFASRESEQQKAFATVYEVLANREPEDELYWFMVGLWHQIFLGEEMDDLITTEQVLKMSQQWALKRMSLPEILSHYEPQDVLLRFKPEERMMGLKPEERVMGLKPEERVMGLKPEERVMGLKPEERVMGLKPQEVLPHYKPEERMMGLNPDDIRAYLKGLEEGQQ